MQLADLDPRRQPKYVRVIVIITMAFFTFIGLCLSLRIISESVPRFFLNWFFMIFCGAFSSAVLIFAFTMFAEIANRNNGTKLEQILAVRGFCTEAADIMKAVMPAPTEADQALRCFLLVMAEEYDTAENEIAHINEPALSMRNFAMVMTSKIRLYMMTGRLEKAERLLQAYRTKLDMAYEAHPYFLENYRSYADDAAEYYMLSAAYYDLMHDAETAEDYRQKAMLASSNRSPAEADFFRRLLELNRLYSTGQFEQAHALENDLRGMAANLPQPASQGTRYDLQRYVEQAKVLSFRNLNINPALMQSRALPEDTGMQIPDTLTSM